MTTKRKFITALAVAGIATTAVIAMRSSAGSSTAPPQASGPVAAPVATATTIPVLPVTARFDASVVAFNRTFAARSHAAGC